MEHLFAGTAWDHPATCERCGKLEPECTCPPPVAEPVRLAPEAQTARLRREKRAQGKLVTVVAGLNPGGNDLPGQAARLKAQCGAGGTVKDGLIELQGDHLGAVESVLRGLDSKTRRQ